MALVADPTQPEYPKMLYRGPWDAEQTLVVNNCQEELDVLDAGWSRTPTPQPPGYPWNMVEVDPLRGSDYRRVLIRNPADEKLFREVVDLRKWTRDDNYALARRGVPLTDFSRGKKRSVEVPGRPGSSGGRGIKP